LLFGMYFLWRVDQERPLLPEQVHAALLVRYERYVRPLLRRLRKRTGALLFKLLGRRAGSVGGMATGEGLLIHANVHTRTFHLPECAQYNSPQCRIEFKDVKVARQAGFHPCGFCATLLDQDRQ